MNPFYSLGQPLYKAATRTALLCLTLVASLGAASFAQPANDLCSNAIAISIGSSVNGTTVNATSTGDPLPCGVGFNGVWYTVVGNGFPITASTCNGTNYDSVLGIFTGNCGSLSQFACNDDNNVCDNLQARVTWQSTAGVVYRIMVSGFSGVTGNFGLSITSSSAVCRGAETTITISPSGVGPFTYQWYKNGTAPGNKLNEVASQQTGTQTATLTLKSGQPGNYYVVVTDQGNGNQQTTYGPYQVTVLPKCPSSGGGGGDEGSSGRVAAKGSEPGTGLRVTMTPNPLSGETLRAIVRGAEGRSLRVELLDLSGRPVRQQSWERAAAEQVVEWNLSGKSAGTYLLQAVSGVLGEKAIQRHSVKVVKP